VTRPLWTSSSPIARGTRLALGPLSWAYGAASSVRARVYARGWRTRRPLPLPALGVGSLQVGGAGKSPVAAWAATEFLRRGATPGILLRGYGGDEGPMLCDLVPGAIVVEDPDRHRGAKTARSRGARVFVLDDNAQHLAVAPTRQLLLLSVEGLAGTRALLPAGPWREPWGRGWGDVIVLTRRDASADSLEAARAQVRRAYPTCPVAIAHLGMAAWRPLGGGPAVSDTDLAGARVFAVCGIADPRSFFRQIAQRAIVTGRRAFRDHARYRWWQVARLARAAESVRADYVVTTAKDAVKLRGRWPDGATPVLVADLAVTWESGVDSVTTALEDCLPAIPQPSSRGTCAAGSLAAGTA
jgi:tetraacyldisaccharide 4'-kinase